MTSTGSTRRPPGRLLLRLADRFASPTARERVFVPLLADFQFEYSQAAGASTRLGVRLRWTLAFCQSLGLEAVNATAAHLRRNAWGTTEEERQATRRLCVRVALAAGFCSLAVTLDMLRVPILRQARGLVGHWALLLPAALCMALPAGSLLGVVLSARDRLSAEPRWRPLLGVASLVGLATFAVAAWITPNANHAWRELVFAQLTSANPGAPIGGRGRGDREMTFGALSARAAELHRGGDRAAAGRIDLEWHKKPALGASCLALALAGAAVARRLRGGALRSLASLFVLLSWYWLLRLGEQAADAGAIAPAVGMWGPCFAVGVLGLGAFHRRPRRACAA